MGVPKSRRTKHRQKMRRMHLFLKTPAFVLCSNCKSQILPHTVCENCGYYNGKQIIDVLGKLSKKERKKKEKEIKEKETRS